MFEQGISGFTGGAQKFVNWLMSWKDWSSFTKIAVLLTLFLIVFGVRQLILQLSQAEKYVNSLNKPRWKNRNRKQRRF